MCRPSSTSISGGIEGDSFSCVTTKLQACSDVVFADVVSGSYLILPSSYRLRDAGRSGPREEPLSSLRKDSLDGVYSRPILLLLGGSGKRYS